jgi:hypothetical protein
VKSDVEIVIEELYSCFYAFAFCDINIGMVIEYVVVLQDCLQLLPWFMNNGQFPFLLYALRIFPDKNMEATVETKLSLETFLWSYGRIFCHMWKIMCIHTMCMSRVAEPDFPKPLWMITEFSTKPSKIHVLLGNIHL